MTSTSEMRQSVSHGLARMNTDADPQTMIENYEYCIRGYPCASVAKA
jgi:hypothetical protein